MTEIKIGDVAKDELTGFEGLVIGRSRYLSNCDRLTLQPRSLDKDGKPQATNSFDITHCALVQAGAVPVPDKSWDRRENIALGDTAKDAITGFQGVVTARTSWIDANDHLSLQPTTLDNDGQPQKPNGFDATRCDLVSKLQPPAPAERRGGPMDEPRRNADPVR